MPAFDRLLECSAVHDRQTPRRKTMSKKLIVGLAIAGSLIAGGTALAADTATDSKSKPAASDKAKPAKEDKAKTDKSKAKSTAEATTPAGAGASADVNTIVVASQPVPDTKENRRAFPPLSALGRSTTPRGN
jgi:hypothetical protein